MFPLPPFGTEPTPEWGSREELPGEGQTKTTGPAHSDKLAEPSQDWSGEVGSVGF